MESLYVFQAEIRAKFFSIESPPRAWKSLRHPCRVRPRRRFGVLRLEGGGRETRAGHHRRHVGRRRRR